MRPFLAALVAAALLAPATAQADIVGGVEAEGDWPFMGYIENARQELEVLDTQYCGASLIAPTWALTAAHCLTVDPLVDPLITTFVIGRHARSDTSSGERIQVKRVVFHENYGSPMADSNDVMLLELERAPQNAQPVRIAGAGEAALWSPGTPATIIGWGDTTDGGSSSDVLREARVPIVTDSGCEGAYPGSIDRATMVCAGYPQGGVDTCQGDSGGPMVVPAADGSWRQVGVTSWGDGCARPEKPGVYSRVAGDSLRAWIAATVPSAISTASAGAPAPAAAPAAAGEPPAGPAPSPPASEPASSSTSTPGTASAKKRSPAARKRACLKKARKVKSSRKRKRAIAACKRAARR